MTKSKKSESVDSINEEEYTRCNHAHSFLHKTAIEYLQKTIVFNEERKNK